MSTSEFRSYLLDPESGLTKRLKIDNYEISSTIWPSEMLSASDSLIFFKCTIPKEMNPNFLHEEHFKLQTQHTTLSSSLVFSENFGGDETYLYVGFARQHLNDDFELLLMTSPLHELKFSYRLSALNKLERIKITP